MKLGQILRIVWLVPSMDKIWTEGSSGRRQFLDRLTLSYFPKHAEVSLLYEKAMKERNRLLKEKIYNDQWYNALEIEMAKSAVSIQKSRMQAIQYLTEAHGMEYQIRFSKWNPYTPDWQFKIQYSDIMTINNPEPGLQKAYEQKIKDKREEINES